METTTNDSTPHFRLPQLRVAPGHIDLDDAKLTDELLSVLLHDLRSPLGAIRVLTDLISGMSQRGEPADSRQLQLLHEAVTRAQRVLDDALEIQSILRGSQTYQPAAVSLRALLDSGVAKVVRAPYFHGGQIEVNLDDENIHVSVDCEKAEAVLLSVVEQLISQSTRQPYLQVDATADSTQVRIQIEEQGRSADGKAQWPPVEGRRTMRGRLGTRRSGESRYSLQVCGKVLKQMGGSLFFHDDDQSSVEIVLPRANR